MPQPFADAPLCVGIGRGGIELDHSAFGPFVIPGLAVEFVVRPGGYGLDQTFLRCGQTVEQFPPVKGLVVPVELLGEQAELVPFETGLREVDRFSPAVAIQPFQHKFIPSQQIGDQIGGTHHGSRSVSLQRGFAGAAFGHLAEVGRQFVERRADRGKKLGFGNRDSHSGSPRRGL